MNKQEMKEAFEAIGSFHPLIADIAIKKYETESPLDCFEYLIDIIKAGEFKFGTNPFVLFYGLYRELFTKEQLVEYLVQNTNPDAVEKFLREKLNEQYAPTKKHMRLSQFIELMDGDVKAYLLNIVPIIRYIATTGNVVDFSTEGGNTSISISNSSADYDDIVSIRINAPGHRLSTYTFVLSDDEIVLTGVKAGCKQVVEFCHENNIMYSNCGENFR